MLDTEYTPHAVAIQRIQEVASDARTALLANVPDEKRQEYLYKFTVAPRLVDGTASTTEIENALADPYALANKITDPKAVGQAWLVAGQAHYQARLKITAAEKQAIAEVEAGDDMSANIIAEAFVESIGAADETVA